MHEIDIKGLDLNLLRVLHVLLEERSVTRAAERLNLSQSATSHALARLRRHFDDPLLTRTPQGMRPTARAETLAPAVGRIMADIAALSGAPAFVPAEAERLVRLTVAITAAIGLVPRLAARLAEAAPKLRLECRQWSADTLDELEAGLIDAAIGTASQRASDRFRIAPLMTEPYVCVVRRGHPVLAEGLTRAAYERWPHVYLDGTDGQRGVANQVLSGLGVNRRGGFSTHHVTTAHLVVEQSDMILTVPRSIAEFHARHGAVAILEPPMDIGQFPLSLIWHPRTTADPLHAWLLGLLIELAAELGKS